MYMHVFYIYIIYIYIYESESERESEKERERERKNYHEIENDVCQWKIKADILRTRTKGFRTIVFFLFQPRDFFNSYFWGTIPAFLFLFNLGISPLIHFVKMSIWIVSALDNHSVSKQPRQEMISYSMTTQRGQVTKHIFNLTWWG